MDGVYPSVTEKRNWVARDELQKVLMSLGLPANMDSSHIVIKGVDEVAWWLLSASDKTLGPMLGATQDSINIFQARTGPISIKHMVAPGISLRGTRPVLDGVAMRLRFAQGNANEGPEAFIIPVTKTMLNSQAEYNTHVALVPRESLSTWMGIVAGADLARRSMEVKALRLDCFNGPSQSIQPMALSDIILDPGLKDSIESDVKGFLSRRSAYTQRAIPWSRKYLFNGPPGTGKTSLARWMATELSMPAVTFDFTDKWADGRDFKSFLSYAMRRGPSLVILDDFEKVMAGENKTGITSHTILTSLSGVASLDGLVFAITSNSSVPFNGPMRRRFDVIKEIGLPGPNQRFEYLQKMLMSDGIDPSFVERMLPGTEGWSFDDLRGIIASALGSSIGVGMIDENSLTNGLAVMQNRRIEDSSGV